MIIVYEQSEVLYIHRRGRQRVVIPGSEAETIRHFLNKLHAEGKLVYKPMQTKEQLNYGIERIE